jgi:hypothetical protein
MSLGNKRTGFIGEGKDTAGDQDLADDLFDQEWDELVICFDRESREYHVKTAKLLSADYVALENRLSKAKAGD